MEINLLTIFLTGLLAGGLSCIAVQGGLLAATVAQRFAKRYEQQSIRTTNSAYVSYTDTLTPLILFLVAKLCAYILLGALLGWFGSLFQLSLTAQVLLQFAVVVFMLGTAFNILNVHPFFRYFNLQPPKFLTRIIRRQSKSAEYFSPALLGGFTVFIPCGVTQAMMALAIGVGNPFLGALILGIFVLGTSPVFFILGFLATRLSGIMQHAFMRTASLGLIALALFNLNNVLSLASFPTLSTIARNTYCIFSFCDINIAFEMTPVTDATITMVDNGYTPLNLAVKQGEEITIHLRNIGANNCVQAFVIPRYGIQAVVPVGKETTIAFKAPEEQEEIPFMCTMGMYRGTIYVI